MAAITHAGTTWSTTAGNKTVTATPAASDLIVVIAATSGLAGGTTAITDNNSDGFGTYTQVDTDRNGFSTTGVLTIWVRDRLIGSATSTVFTAAQAGSTGGGLTVLRVSGMSRYGTLAVRSNGGESAGSSGTAPGPVLSNTPLSGNPVIGAVACSTNATTNFTPRASYAEHTDSGYNTPPTGLEVMSIDSGETTATITWGSNAPSAFASVAIELDTSAIPGPEITAFETADWTGTGATKTITVTGALNGDKIVVFYGGDEGLGSDAVTAASVSTTGGSTGSWTEPQEGIGINNAAWASSAYADVTGDGTVTVQLARTQTGTQRLWGGFALLARNHGGIGNTARSAPSATETASLTISQDSAVGALIIDWDVTTVVAFSPSGATDVERANHTDVVDYAGYWLAQASGTRGYGIATSSSTSLHIIAIEILAETGTNATAGNATATGTAETPTRTVSTGSQVSSGIGAADNPSPSIRASSGAAEGTGTANNATVQTSSSGTNAQAETATATGTAETPIRTVSSTIGSAVATGAAQDATAKVSPTADAATGTGVANNATVQTGSFTNAQAGVATGTGTANSPGGAVVLGAQVATGAGTANNAVAGASVTAQAGVATGTGTANGATVTVIKFANAENAAGVGTVNAVSLSVRATAEAAAAIGEAFNVGSTLRDITVTGVLADSRWSGALAAGSTATLPTTRWTAVLEED